jgi:ABC-type multidrug transport system ATPase subunit
MTSSHEHVLELHNVKKAFGAHKVLDGINLEIKAGESVAIVGPSGSGKSTLFKILLGYFSPDAGKILFRGKNIVDDPHLLRRHVGYTTQGDSFYHSLTVRENMRYYARLYRVRLSSTDLQTHIDELLRKVDLFPARDVIVETLSGGMRRRLNVAISLVHSPEILIMDEPTTGLDPVLVDRFWGLVASVKKEGKTIVFTSHLFDEVIANADRVIIIAKGEVKDVLTGKDRLKLRERFKEVGA